MKPDFLRIFRKKKKLSVPLLMIMWLLVVITLWQLLSVAVVYRLSQQPYQECRSLPGLFASENYLQASAAAKNCFLAIGELSARLPQIDRRFGGGFHSLFYKINNLLFALADVISDSQEAAVLLSGKNNDNGWSYFLKNYPAFSALNSRFSSHLQSLLTALQRDFPLLGRLLKNRLNSLVLMSRTSLAWKNLEPFGQLLSLSLGENQEKTYLLFFQNSAELRPTGGFWGSYGLLKVANGKIISLTVDDIYHLDAKLQDLPAPPAPLKKYLQVEKWYLRDANWSPDFAEAAQLGQKLYHQAMPGSAPLAGVIAITPQLVEDLLAYLGPIVLDGQSYSRENFIEELQLEVEKNYQTKNIPAWNRKDILQVLADKFLEKLPSSVVTFADTAALVDIIRNNLAQKNIIMYFNEPKPQAIVRKNNWGGLINPNFDDYLAVIDSNLASFKTDQYIERKLTYVVEQENPASAASALIATLTINYSHRGNFDWKTTRYRTYTRVYVPPDSQLLFSAGAMDNDRSSEPGQVDIYHEFGKTVFGAFIAVEPQQGGSLIFRYRLPAGIRRSLQNGQYRLLWQKQAGVENQSIELNIKVFWPITMAFWQNSDYYILNDQLFIHETPFRQDCHLIINKATNP